MGTQHSLVMAECATAQESQVFRVSDFAHATEEQIFLVQKILSKIPSLTKVEAVSGDLQMMPEIWTCKSVVSCLLSDNKIASPLPEELGACSQRLRKLALNGNCLGPEFSTILLQIPSLVELLLSHNSLSYFPAAVEINAAALKLLDLEHNSLEDVSLLSSLQNLETLKLTSNRIGFIPEGFSGLTNLTSLHLGHNFVHSIPALPVSLRFLHLNNNSVESASSISTLKNLRVCALQHNVLDELPENVFQSMTDLQTLALNGNALMRLPPSIGRLLSLNRLFLHENCLLTLPEEIGDCSELTTLRIEYNELRILPKSLARCKFLLVIVAHNNRLTQFPEFVSSMPQLLRLSLEFNPIKDMGPGATGGTLAGGRERTGTILSAAPSTGSGSRERSGSIQGPSSGSRRSSDARPPSPQFLDASPSPPSSPAMKPKRTGTVIDAPNSLRRDISRGSLKSSNKGAILEDGAEAGSTLKSTLTRSDSGTLVGSGLSSLLSSGAEFDPVDFRPTEDFHQAFLHFVETRDFSPSKSKNFLRAPPQAKLVLMRQHRDAILRLFMSGRAPDESVDNVEALAAHQIDPLLVQRVLQATPSIAQLRRVAAGIEEFQDAWFGLLLEYGLFDDVLKLLHQTFRQLPAENAEEYVLVLLRMFEAIFDAVWKTVLVTHGSIPVLALHLDSPFPSVAERVLHILLEITRIPEAGVCVVLKGLEMRRRMLGDSARFGILHMLMMEHRLVAALSLFNAILEASHVAERKDLRKELMDLHAGGATNFIDSLNSNPAMAAELDAFLETLKEEQGKIAKLEGNLLSTPAVQDDGGAKAGKRRGSRIVLKVKEVAFDVTAVPPLVKIRKRGLMLKIGLTVAKITRQLVAEFEVDPAQDYRLMYVAPDADKTQVWLDDDKALSQYPDLNADESESSPVPLFFSLKPVPMTIQLPSGEIRTVSLILAALVKDLLAEIRVAIDDLPEGKLRLAVNQGRDRLVMDKACNSQGVEPYTVLFVVVVDDDDESISTDPSSMAQASSVAIQRADGTTMMATGLQPMSSASASALASDKKAAEEEEPVMNIWDEAFGPKYIVIENGEVTSASINKIIERMTSIETIDLTLTSVFLYTYKSFTNAEEVWMKLMERYNVPERVSEQDTKKLRLRVCMFIKKWMEMRRTGDINPDLLMKIMDFIEQRLAADGLAEMQSVLFRIMTGASAEKIVSYNQKQPPKAKQPKVKSIEKMTVLDVDPLELARQITLFTWEQFIKIKPYEFFNQNWMRKNKENLAPNIVKLIDMFNHMSGAIATVILSESRVRKRVVLVERFIDVAVELRKLNNFLMTMSFISAFAQASVNRLRFTMDRVSEAHKERLRELQALMNPEKSFQHYRRAYDSLTTPGIPYLGAYLTDLTFIEEASLSKIGPRINLQKHTMVFGVLEKLQLLNRKLPLNLEPLESVQQWVLRLPVLGEKELYDLSLLIEPRGADSVK